MWLASLYILGKSTSSIRKLAGSTPTPVGGSLSTMPTAFIQEVYK
jgi:hypothetical protein